jgi:hypothetical protein
MTNQPPFDQQMAINEYWKNVNGSGFFRFSPRPEAGRGHQREHVPVSLNQSMERPRLVAVFLCIHDPDFRWLGRNAAPQGIWRMFGQWW